MSALWHSAKKPTFVCSGPVFAECPVFDTRRRIQVCRVSGPGHSAKVPWPSPRRRVTFFRRASVSALGKVFAECPIENTRQRDVCRLCVRWVPFTKCNTRQRICRVFFRLCRVPVTHGKASVSGSALRTFGRYWCVKMELDRAGSAHQAAMVLCRPCSAYACYVASSVLESLGEYCSFYKSTM